MIISVNWLKKFVPIDMSIDELVALIGARLVEVEGVKNLSEKYKDTIVAKVVSVQPVEDSDHLSLVYIDDGGVVSDVARQQDGTVQVVCGAPNVRQGMLVAWLPPKSTVPDTFESDEPFVLSARKLRGHVSNGMLASARELDLFDEHDGILEVDKDVHPGALFADVYDLNDTLIDIENKSLTHRPDTFGIIGFAREVAGIQGKQFQTPDWLQDVNAAVALTGGEREAPKISIQDAGLSQRFQLVVIDGVREDAVSPVEMQTFLARSGVRPINAVVDISNYLMLLTGQPTHMYDYHKVKAVAGDDFTVGVRVARDDETLVLLDGKEVALDGSDIVITAGDTPIGLAGIMGGQSTTVDKNTTITLLEVATFDLYHMRSSQMRHGIFSEAVTRYTKGIPAELGRPVLARAVSMAEELIGAVASSEPLDAYPGQEPLRTIPIDTRRVNTLLGTHFSEDDIIELLGNVEITAVQGREQEVTFTIPYWRTDVVIEEDIIEEVGRLSGFDHINATMPQRDFTAIHPSRFDTVRTSLRSALVKAGMNEVLTYSFVHGDLLKKAGQDTANSYRITNSISPDLQYYRQSLTPSLLQHITPNARLGFESFGIFELNKVHRVDAGVTEESVPIEIPSLALTVTRTKTSLEAPYYQAKYLLEYMLASVGINDVAFERLDTFDGNLYPYEMVFEPKRSARIRLSSGEVVGVVGEYKQSIARTFKLPAFTAGFELLLDSLIAVAPLVPVAYTPPSRYPGIERDICFRISNDISYAQLLAAVETALNGVSLETSVSPLDVYRADGSETKNVTLRLSFVSHQKTLTSDEINEVMTTIIDNVAMATHGEVV